MSQQGKSTSGSHKSRGRAPRPLLSALPLPEIAQGLQGGEDPSTAPSTHLHSVGETGATRRDLQRSNGADGGQTQPWLLHHRWVLQPQNPRHRLGQRPLWLRKQTPAGLCGAIVGLTPGKLGPPGGQKGVREEWEGSSDIRPIACSWGEGAGRRSSFSRPFPCLLPQALSPHRWSDQFSPPLLSLLQLLAESASICCPLPPGVIPDLCGEPFNLSQSPVTSDFLGSRTGKEGFLSQSRRWKGWA